jgi:hypothetical protein
LIAIAATLALGVGTVHAQEPPASGNDPKPAKPEAEKAPAARPPAKKTPAKKTPAKPGPAKPPTGKNARPAEKPISLQVPKTEPAPGQRIDLFPSTVLQKAATGDPGKNERRTGASLGNDGGWKTQAAQVGVMVGLFAGLAALCGSGNCTVPDGWTSWLPDTLRADPGGPPTPPPSEPERKAR